MCSDHLVRSTESIADGCSDVNHCLIDSSKQSSTDATARCRSTDAVIAHDGRSNDRAGEGSVGGRQLLDEKEPMRD